MDGTEIRKGKPCLYKKAGVGLSAINYAFLMQTSVFKLIRVVLLDHPKCLNIIDLAIDTYVKTSLGQSIDLKLRKYGKMKPSDFSLFTSECYKSLVHSKTSYYTFIFPFIAGYLVSGRTDLDNITQKFCNILLDIGLIFQIQDDYLDVYGDPNITGIIGTDIQEGKCTWLIVQILPLLSAEDRLILMNCYGLSYSHCVNSIHKLYEKYDLKHRYESAIDDLIAKTIVQIEAIAPPSFATYYKNYLNSIRQKQK
uniref:Farnesyl pyrophosphate synthase n=1 Tax=Myxobolus squamalis TaxID=59785 RepID=A0A6B2G434_MYXSQ